MTNATVSTLGFARGHGSLRGPRSRLLGASSGFVAGLLTAVIGVLGALRHVDATLFATLAPSFLHAKFNCSICLLALGVALCSHFLKPNWRGFRTVLGALVLLLSGVSLAQIVFGWDLGIDQLFVRDTVPDYFPPGRIGLNSAVCLILEGTALLLLQSGRRQWPAHVAAAAAASIALIVFVGHATGMETNMRVALVGVMAQPVAAGFVLFGVGLLCVRTQSGLLQRFHLPKRAILPAVVAWVVLLMGVAWLYFRLAGTALNVARNAFALRTMPVTTALVQQMDLLEQMLLGARVLFVAADRVDADEWHRFAIAQDESSAVPGTLGVGWGEPPISVDGEVSVVHFDEFAGNVGAMGYELARGAVAQDAIRVAVRTGQATLSAPERLPGKDEASGFALYVPIYPPRVLPATNPDVVSLLGIAYSPVRLREFMDALARDSHYRQADFAFDLRDAGEPQHPLYRSTVQQSATQLALYTRQASIHVGQREWQLSFSSLPHFDYAYQSMAPLAVLHTGVALSLSLIVVVFVVLDAYRKKSMSLATRTGQLDYQIEFNRLVTHQMVDPVVVSDMQERVTFINAAAEQTLGYSMPDLEQRSVLAAFGLCSEPDAVAADDCPLRRAYVGEPVTNCELVLTKKNGKTLDVLVSAAPLTNRGAQIGVVFVAHDITARKQAAEFVSRTHKEVQQFTYIASHDLQTPLRSLVSFSQLLQTSLAGRLEPSQSDWLQRVAQNTLRIQQLLNLLLDYSRIGLDSGQIEPVDLNAIVRAALITMRDAVLQCDAQIVCEPLPTVRGETRLLLNVMEHLLSNALKFRSEKRRLMVTVYAEMTSGMHVIRVRDNGIGIDSLHQERIFDLFRRLHTATHYSGTGVGLAVCRRAIEYHGGRLWVESTLDQGSTFSFTLPTD